MNKTHPINISGIIFYINDDAYEILEQYLNELKQHYLKTEDGTEIIADIESRIAELFSEKITESKQVITKSEVERIISILGKLNDIEDENFEFSDSDTNPQSKKTAKNRKFYRDANDGILAGVASGLSHYFGIDVIFIRILFILLVLGGTVGFWVYVILWIVSPYARTSAERLEMRGEPVNLSNLEKTIKEEFENVKESFQNKNVAKRVNTFLGRFIHLIFQIIIGVFAALKYIFGSIFLVVGVILISLLTSFFIFDSTIISINNEQWVSLPLQEILVHFISTDQSEIILLSFAGFIGIPIISLIYSGIKLLFGFTIKNKAFGVTTFVLWIFSAIILAIGILNIAKEFQVNKQRAQTININEVYKQIYIKVNDNSSTLNSDEILFEDNTGEVIITKKQLYIKSEFEVWESKDSLFHIKIKKHALGKNKHDASRNIENISYNIRSLNDTLYLDYYANINNRFRGQEVEIQVFKPKGTIINSNMKDFIEHDYSE